MQRSEWDFENRIDDDEPDVALPGSPQVLADLRRPNCTAGPMHNAFYCGYMGHEQAEF